MMTAKDRKVFAIALVLVALVSIFVPVASAVSQTWYLCTDSTPFYTLEKTAPEDGTVDVANGATIDWSAGPAECDLTMGDGTWILDLDYDAPAGGGTVDISIWRWGDTSPQYEIASASNVALSGGTGQTEHVEMTGSDTNFESADNDYLTLLIKWTQGGTPGSLTVNCGTGDSTLKSPSSDPGFPVPELSSLVLFSVGLLALVGYVVYRRRDR